ncbi:MULTISPECIES: cytochrome c550 [Psychrobacillus]|uniref:Cytochrome c n=1 Tax=Psychrobacillus lasiicapitis TaxID=1636719 RepID=A0A544TA45_9BACI|nr:MULTISPECIES: cytochrome c [Psychrobacillus]MDI2588138.1 cytochrome c [Psychrobacillus sp. NEAU-3TGS]TQR14325.1 cytochrome c [Psychrobacillus lasiicapitis]GGA32286.1 cytochrome c-550 [Psychrobacillus lasiicapitis]
MKKNPIIPFLLIMGFGIGLIFFLSIQGVNNKEEIAATEEAAEGGAAEGEATAGEFDPAEFAQGKCISCHGANFEGQGNFPSLVGTALSEDEVKDVLANGRGAMPGGLVPAENIDAMAAWVKSLE